MRRIDVHHHAFPPDYLEALDRLGVKEHGGGDVAFPDWSPAASLQMMDRHDIATAILSIASPGIYFGEVSLARDLARRCNEYLADLTRKHPRRFGFFASIPLPATDEALKEAAYAFETLKCNGVVLLGSVADRFLGDPEFEPLMQELHRRSAVVFIHPNVHSSSRMLGLKFPAALFEFLADTTRAVLNLTLSGTLHRYPNIRWILSHAGGAVACHAWRWGLTDRSPIVQKNAPLGVLTYLRRLYFDTALSPSSYPIRPVLDLAGPTQLLFGSDFPFVNGEVLAAEIEAFGRLDLTERDLSGLTRANALRLFPPFNDSALSSA